MNKISLIGAGNIGTILAYSIARKNLGNIVLVDVVDGLAEGKCLDLGQSLPIDKLNLKILGTNDISKIHDSDVIIITAGIARKPGMSRDDLIETNFKIMQNIGIGYQRFFTKLFCNLYHKSTRCYGLGALKEISGLKKNSIVGMAGISRFFKVQVFFRKRIKYCFRKYSNNCSWWSRRYNGAST